jgi:hypothetical protein
MVRAMPGKTEVKTAPPTIALPLANRIYGVRIDLDRATSMAKEFLRATPARSA